MKRAGALLFCLCLLSHAGFAEDGEYSHYYGDIHSHTGFSDGSEDSTPAEAYAHARDVAGLDFYCVTDHYLPLEPNELWSLSPEEYAQLKAMADAANQDGSFVTLYGYEWTKDKTHGNVFMAPDLITATTPGTFYPELFARKIADPRIFGQFNHPAIEGDSDWGDWLFSSKGAWCMRLVETRSDFPPALSRGDLAGEIAEYVEALEKGWLVGVDGSKDTHDARWGEFGDEENDWQQCTTVALVASLTRENILNSLRMRRTYVSQDTDFLSHPLNVTLRASRDGGVTYPYIMGEALDAEGAPHVALRFTAGDGGSDELDEMRIYKNGTCVSRQTGINNTDAVLDCSDGSPSHGDFYFGVVIEEDGNVAVTSPIFIRNGDADSDGLTDEEEINSRETNPDYHDTDGDGFNDGDEAAAGTDPLNPADYPGSATPTATPTITAAPTVTPTETPPPCIDLRVSAPMVSNGDRFTVDVACHCTIEQSFDAYCIAVFPNGSLFSLTSFNHLAKGLTPLASSVPALRAGYATRLADLILRHAALGEYTLIAGAVPAGAIPRMDTTLCYSQRMVVVTHRSRGDG